MTGVQTCALPICFPVTISWLNKLGRIQFDSNGVTFVTGESAEQTLNKALAELDTLEAEIDPVVGTIGQIESLSDAGAYVADAVGNLVSTVLISAPTAGSALLTSMVGEGINDSATEKAKRLGITKEELFKQGKVDIATPVVTKSLGYALEKVGLKGISNVINRGILDGTLKTFTIVANDLNKEGLTELVQLGLDTYSNSIAQGMTVAEAVEQAGYAMGSKEGLEVYAKGLVGAGALAGAGSISRRVYTKAAKTKASKIEENIQSSLQDLSKDNISQEAKTAIAEGLYNNVEQLQTLAEEDGQKLSNLNEASRQNIENINNKIQSINNSLQDTNISDNTRSYLEEEVKALENQVNSILNDKENQQEVSGEVVEGQELTQTETNEGWDKDVESTAKALEDSDFKTSTPIKGLSVRMSDLRIAEDNLSKGKKSITPNEPIDVTINLTTGNRELSDGYHRYLDARGGTIEKAKTRNLEGSLPSKIKLKSFIPLKFFILRSIRLIILDLFFIFTSCSFIIINLFF